MQQVATVHCNEREQIGLRPLQALAYHIHDHGEASPLQALLRLAREISSF